MGRTLYEIVHSCYAQAHGIRVYTMHVCIRPETHMDGQAALGEYDGQGSSNPMLGGIVSLVRVGSAHGIGMPANTDAYPRPDRRADHGAD